jgi:hypothetical protein
MLWKSSWMWPYTDTPADGGPRFWEFGVRLSGYDAMMSWLRLLSPANCIPLSQYICKVFENLKMLWKSSWMWPYTDTPADGGPDFGNCGTSTAYEHCETCCICLRWMWEPFHVGLKPQQPHFGLLYNKCQLRIRAGFLNLDQQVRWYIHSIYEHCETPCICLRWMWEPFHVVPKPQVDASPDACIPWTVCVYVTHNIACCATYF